MIFTLLWIGQRELFFLFFLLLPTQNSRLYPKVCEPLDGNWFPSGDHGHQQSRHPWPGAAASWPSGPKDRVPSARPTPEASDLHHHHRQDEHQRGSRPWRLRRTSRQNLRCWYQCYLPGGELVWEYWNFVFCFICLLQRICFREIVAGLEVKVWYVVGLLQCLRLKLCLRQNLD